MLLYSVLIIHITINTFNITIPIYLFIIYYYISTKGNNLYSNNMNSTILKNNYIKIHRKW